MTAEANTRARSAALPVPRPMLVLVGVLVVLVIGNGLIDSNYLSVAQLRNTLVLAVPLALMAGGQTLVMLTGGIDLSVGMTATGAAYVAGAAASQGTALSIAEGVALGLVIGLINGIAIGVFHVHPLIMTLGMTAILTGVLTVGSQTFLSGSTAMPDFVVELGSGTLFGPVPWNLLVWLVLGALLVLGLRRTGLGRMIYAVGDNRRAVRLGGGRVWQVEIAVYTLCGILAAAAGILIGGRIGSVDLEIASEMLLPSVAAAVIGGTSILGGVGGYAGTILGALILTVLDTMLNLLAVDYAYKQILYGVVVLALAWAYVRGARRDTS